MQFWRKIKGPLIDNILHLQGHFTFWNKNKLEFCARQTTSFF